MKIEAYRFFELDDHYKLHSIAVVGIRSKLDWGIASEWGDARCLCFHSSTCSLSSSQSGLYVPVPYAVEHLSSDDHCTCTASTYKRCGFYALRGESMTKNKAKEILSLSRRPISIMVLSKVELAGFVVEGEYGYQATKGRVVALIGNRSPYLWTRDFCLQDNNYKQIHLTLYERYKIPTELRLDDGNVDHLLSIEGWRTTI